MTKLNYFDYNINSFGLIGDDEKKLGKHIRSLGGRWNNRMKGGSGWLVPRDREDVQGEGLDDAGGCVLHGVCSIGNAEGRSQQRAQAQPPHQAHSLR